MNCRNFEKLVLVIAQNRLLDAAVRESGLRHVEECALCAVRLSEERALLAGLRTVVAEIACEEAPKRVEAVLLTAFREQARVAPTPALARLAKQPGLGSRRKLASLAAGIILLISAVAILWAQATSPTRQRQEQAGPYAPADGLEKPPLAPKDSEVAFEVAQPAASSPSGRAPRQRVRNRLKQAEVVTEFFPLLEGDDLDSLESGQIVRVELSGAALLAVGLPFDAARAGESVKADLVVGDDGLARAIRFVR
jgi:hypothetical protein